MKNKQNDQGHYYAIGFVTPTTQAAKKVCLHKLCECRGTGVRRDGTPCVHHISCPCDKCRTMR